MLHYSTPPPRRQRENTPQTRTVHLTWDGMKLLPHAQRLIVEYERLQVQVDELNGLQSGLIRIDRHALAAAIIKEFQRDSSSIDCEPLLSDCTEIEEWIVRGAWTAVSGAAGHGNRLPHARPVDGYSAGRSSPP